MYSKCSVQKLKLLCPLSKENICGNLPRCKTDNSHSAGRAGDVYTPHLAAWLSVYQHKRYRINALPRNLAAGPPVCRRSRGHYHLSARTRPLHHAEARAREEAVPFERATHPSAPYARDGRPQAIPVSEAPQKPRRRRTRRLPVHHLVQPATP
jgi:hypothetical protein